MLEEEVSILIQHFRSQRNLRVHLLTYIKPHYEGQLLSKLYLARTQHVQSPMIDSKNMNGL